MAITHQFKRKHAFWLIAAVGLGAVAVWHFTRPDPDTLRLPLGVEQAAIVTYSGPVLTVAPYKWGVAVNVRIAEVFEQPGRRVYDLRYIVNRAGTFDLKDYLAAEDGSALDDLPTFEFTGDSKLSKNLDTRIQETEQIRVDVGGRYYETMAILTSLWIAWLLLLIFYKRPKPPAEPDSGPPEPSLAEQLRGFLAQLEAGTLDAAAKAQMEMALFHCWRDELALGDRQMATALEQIRRDEKTGKALQKLQHWLHHPASPVPGTDIAAVIKPYTLEVAPLIFQHPHLLGLLALPVILAFWEWTRRGQPIAMPFDHGQQGRGYLLRFLVQSANTLPAALLAFAILFLAHPMTHLPPEIERKLNNVQFLLDTSGSMAEDHGSQADGRHRRFDSAMDAIEQFISHRQGDAFGLTIFSRHFIHWGTLTLDTQSIPLSKRFIGLDNPKLDPPGTPRRGLPNDLWGITIGNGLYGVADLLAGRPTGDRMIILMTDGESGDIKPPLDGPIIDRLRSEGITVFTIMLSGDKISDPLIGITRATGGEVFNAVTPEALDNVFHRIDEMKKVVILEKRPRVIDFYDPFFLPAIGLLAASVLALFGLRFTPW